MGWGRARQPLQPGHTNTEEIRLQPCSVSGRGSHLLPLGLAVSLGYGVGSGEFLRVVNKSFPVVLGCGMGGEWGEGSSFVLVAAQRPRGHFCSHWQPQDRGDIKDTLVPN